MRYPGGKGKCFQQIINLMPRHDVYIESHLGGGAVMRNKRPARRSIGIERDSRALAMWKDTDVPALELIHDDAHAVLAGFMFTGRELVYSDPPYLPATRRRSRVYRHDYTESDHVSLLELLRALPCQVMISGYDHPIYRELLRGWRHVTFQTRAHNGLREESVWMNFPTPSELHDPRYLGYSFRERQRIGRKQASIRRRIAAMPILERASLLRWANDTYRDEQSEELCNVPI